MTPQEFQDEQTRAVCLLPHSLQHAVAHAAWQVSGDNPAHETVVANTRKIADALLGPVRSYTEALRRESAADYRF